MKVNARNNIIRKLANSKRGCKASTLRPSCVALCYSAAEYACHVWTRSTHARKLNPALHDCCRIISGCLKPTNLDSVHLLAGIAPPQIKRTVACRMERTRHVPASVKMGLEVAESLPVGSGEDWLCWRALSRLHTWVGRAKTVMRRWGIYRRYPVGGVRLWGATYCSDFDYI